MPDTSPSLLTFIASQRARAAELAETAAAGLVRADAVAEVAQSLPDEISQGLEGARRSGELLERFHTAVALAERRGLQGDEATAAAVFALLREQGQRTGRALLATAQAWRDGARRAEGASQELLRVAGELAALPAPAPDVVLDEPPSAPVAGPPAAEAPPDGGQGPEEAPAAPGGDEGPARAEEEPPFQCPHPVAPGASQCSICGGRVAGGTR